MSCATLLDRLIAGPNNNVLSQFSNNTAPLSSINMTKVSPTSYTLTVNPKTGSPVVRSGLIPVVNNSSYCTLSSGSQTNPYFVTFGFMNNPQQISYALYQFSQAGGETLSNYNEFAILESTTPNVC